MMIRPASASELAALSELCLRSKGYWGYEADFLTACRGELTLTASDLRHSALAVAEHDGRVAGVAQVQIAGSVCDLLKLFVEPALIGQGYGVALFDWAIAEARRGGATLMTIEADPGAAPFYQKRGARLVGAAPSGSIPDRRLPLLELALGAA